MKTKLVLMAAVFLFSLTAIAEDSSVDRTFKLLDKNNDGFITKMEASSAKKLIKDWDSIDKDKNGKIAMTEFSSVKSAEAYTPVEEENEPIGAAPTE